MLAAAHHAAEDKAGRDGQAGHLERLVLNLLTQIEGRAHLILDLIDILGELGALAI
jgi:hypothetical protein